MDRTIQVAVALALTAVAACASDDDQGDDGGNDNTEVTAAADLPTTKDPSVSDGTCPNKVQVGGGDASSIEVFSDTQRTNPRDSWCEEFTISRITRAAIESEVMAQGCWSTKNVTDLASCPYRGLAAIEIGPDTDFIFYSTGKPELEYDLTPGGSTSTFECEAIITNTDGNCNPYLSDAEQSLKFSFYRYRPDSEMTSPTKNRWAFTGSGTLTDPNLVSGTVNHFSRMVAVELPPATVLADAIDGEATTIDSAFDSAFQADDAAGFDLYVAIRTTGDDELTFAPDGNVERLIQFIGEVDATVDVVAPCVDGDPLADLLTCAFPVDSEVVLTWDGGTFVRLDGATTAELEVSGGLAVY